MTESVFSVDTKRFSSISFSDSGRLHTPEYYDNLHLSSDERLLFQIMAHPKLTTGLFNTGQVLMGKDDLVAAAVHAQRHGRQKRYVPFVANKARLQRRPGVKL